jgi:hypothetical protein
LRAGPFLGERSAASGSDPGRARDSAVGEIYLHARFRDAVPAALVEEFDHLEPKDVAATEHLKEVQTARR